MDFRKIFLLIRAVPKTLYFNIKYLPLSFAIKIPIIVSHRVILKSMKGKVEINKNSILKTGMIRIGFHENTSYDQKHNYLVWNVKGKIIFEGSVSIGNGTIIYSEGTLKFGNECSISGNSIIRCYHSITFGSNSLIGDACRIQDGDSHRIFNNQGNCVNESKAICIGDHVWLAAGCSVLKGVKIANNTVIGLGTIITKSLEKEHVVVAGNPPRIIREQINWTI